MNRKSSIAGLFLILLSPLLYAGTWTPIAGIPAPSFGIVEEPPALPSNWDSDVTGFYYVCPSCANSGSASLGNPSSPRRDVPNNVSSGDVVVLAGEVTGGNFNFVCTASAPCFIISDAANPATISGATNLDGSYYIFDSIHVTLPTISEYGHTLGINGDHISFRNGEVSGNLSNGGTGTSGTNIVMYNNDLHDNGDVNATTDQDRHGVKVFGSDTWIISNEMKRNSGDGVQVGDIGTLSTVKNIYVGGNIAYNNKQTGFWVKEAENVIFSQNLAYDHVASGSSSGEGFGGQYDSEHVWFIFNESRNNVGGIGFKSGNNGAGANTFVVGNYIHDNINGDYDPGNTYGLASVFSWNNSDITIVNNTMNGNSGGINLNGNTGTAYIYNNTITSMQAAGAIAINAADPGDIAFEDANATDGQSTIDQGVAPVAAKDPYTIFESRFGRSILVDFDGMDRPVGEWDIGAYESQDGAVVKPNPPILSVPN